MIFPVASPMVVYARFKGPNGLRRELRTLVRPGAPYCFIDRDDAARMGFPQALLEPGPMQYEMRNAKVPLISTAMGFIEGPLFVLPEISLGDLSAKGVQTLCYDLPDASHIDAVLGETFLRNFVVSFDYRKGELRIE